MHPFNQDFCSHLEYRLSASFKYSTDDRVKVFGCDGINHEPYPIEQLSIRSITNTKKISTKSWIGKDGQDIYEMTIYFSEHTIDCLNEGKLINTIPEESDTNWWDIDIDQQTIDIYLK
ncbi:MAG: hypothetical protein H6551_01380 [Chitinophagales bacterium]|nr:hypothetical protein [Chitinophagaceae bacterium]MCB9063777.1 hypothetical protein [Chitinophagales bacterium]